MKTIWRHLTWHRQEDFIWLHLLEKFPVNSGNPKRYYSPSPPDFPAKSESWKKMGFTWKAKYTLPSTDNLERVSYDSRSFVHWFLRWKCENTFDFGTNFRVASPSPSPILPFTKENSRCIGFYDRSIQHIFALAIHVSTPLDIAIEMCKCIWLCEIHPFSPFWRQVAFTTRVYKLRQDFFHGIIFL